MRVCRRVGAILLALCAAGAPAVCRGAEAVQVFILAGQSNALGYNDYTEYPSLSPRGERFPAGLLVQPEVMFWPGPKARVELRDKWVDLQVGAQTTLAATPLNAFGPEITFGRDMAAAMPGTQIAVVRYAVANTGIARHADYTDHTRGDDRDWNWHPPEAGRPTGKHY